MTENILVAVAWPYASSQIHVGNITGSYLPADIFARYQRLKGQRVLMVSGSDSHGTPVTVAADAEGKSILQVYQHYHHGFLELFQALTKNCLPARTLKITQSISGTLSWLLRTAACTLTSSHREASRQKRFLPTVA
jgi:leucyl-tRNA synthetase